MTRPATYVFVLLAAALLSGTLAYAGVWAAKVKGCRMLDRPGAYLAYCDTPAFGSYEHEAYTLGFEPGAVRAMQNAQVLFLGNSRVQHAFSTPQTNQFFQAAGASFHVFGFGYGESSALPRLIFGRAPPHPKAVVINADPFFQPVFSPAAYDMMNLKGGAWVDAGLKKAFGKLLPWLCRMHMLCSGTVATTYRDASTGQWIGHDLMVSHDIRNVPITAVKAAPWREDSVPAWVKDARSFVAALPVPRSCIFLVGVPTPYTDSEGMALAIGRQLDLPVIQVSLHGLESSDGSHLTTDSAERWSAAFFAAAGPRLTECLSKGRD